MCVKWYTVYIHIYKKRNRIHENEEDYLNELSVIKRKDRDHK